MTSAAPQRVAKRCAHGFTPEFVAAGECPSCSGAKPLNRAISRQGLKATVRCVRCHGVIVRATAKRVVKASGRGRERTYYACPSGDCPRADTSTGKSRRRR